MSSAVLLALMAGPLPAQELPVLYLPLDGTPEPALSAPGVKLAADGGLAFEAGVVGEGALVTDDCRYAVGEAFPATGGTFAAWIRPRWAGSPQCSHPPPAAGRSAPRSNPARGRTSARRRSRDR
jgi:hypothetical protein